MLALIYGMDIRLKEKTISYALPYNLNKGGKTKAVRGSKLGKRFTVEGIEQYLQEKERKRLEYQRTEWEIEESQLTVDDYFDWVLGIHFILQFRKSEKKETICHSLPAFAVSLLGGAYIGFICGVQGTGGGLMMLFVLNILLQFEFRTAVGTSVCIMSITALIGAGTHFAVNGLPNLRLLILCVVVTLVTAELAAVFANHMKPRVLKLWTGILMTGSGVIMLLEKLV